MKEESKEEERKEAEKRTAEGIDEQDAKEAKRRRGDLNDLDYVRGINWTGKLPEAVWEEPMVQIEFDIASTRKNS